MLEIAGAITLDWSKVNWPLLILVILLTNIVLARVARVGGRKDDAKLHLFGAVTCVSILLAGIPLSI